MMKIISTYEEVKDYNNGSEVNIFGTNDYTYYLETKS